MGKMNTIFDADSVESILDALEKEGSDWSKKQFEIISKLVINCAFLCYFSLFNNKYLYYIYFFDYLY